MKAIDLTGIKFNRLTVLEKAKSRNNGQISWVCKCECGKIKEVRGNHLTSGETKSCGCLNRTKNQLRTHSQSLVRDGKQILGEEYKSWRSMKQRCLNPNYTFYKNYGGRGITVCDEWVSDFSRFLKDMGPRPIGYSLDRIDNGKGYFPDNCRWADRTTQNRNRRNCKPEMRNEEMV